ncbi:MAG: flagellar biosynthetic protein FliO [Alphaproteobacteria bacterium]
MEISEIVQFAAALLFVLALIILVAWVLRRYFGGGARAGGSPLRRRERRLGVVEAAQIGNRHRLVLVRRDDREHLLLLGGSNELVVESNITTRTETAEVNIRATEPTFTSPAPAAGNLAARNPEPSFERASYEHPAPESFAASSFPNRDDDEIAFSSQTLSDYKDTNAGSAYLADDRPSYLEQSTTGYDAPDDAERFPPAENESAEAEKTDDGQSRILNRFLNKSTD